MSDSQVIELNFSIVGTHIPVDHGYALYSAISKIIDSFHEADGILLAPIRGRYFGNGCLDISPRTSMCMRLSAERIHMFLPLAGKTIDVHGSKLNIGIPRPSILKPASVLYSHFVTTRNGDNIERFEAKIRRRLAELEITVNLKIGRRKTMKIHNKQIVGYEMRLSELSDSNSITIQASGLGGRSKMGCGFFVAADVVAPKN